MNNHTTVIGRVGTHPETRKTPWGALEATFRLATTERWRNKEGEWADGPTSWFTVRTSRRLAEHVRDSVKTGQQLIVSGKVRTRTWENDNGKGMTIEVEADHVGPDLLIAPATVHPRPKESVQEQQIADVQPGHPDQQAHAAPLSPLSPHTPASAPGIPMNDQAPQAGGAMAWATAPVGAAVGVGVEAGSTTEAADDPPF